MTILFTGFDPFGGERVNPAFEAVRRLPGEIGGARIVKQELPTVFGRAGEVLISAIERERPDAVICVGQSGGSAAIAVERIGVNLRDARSADNAGRVATDEAIIPGGSGAYFATIPVKAIRDAITAAGIPAGLSTSAGLFVCNDVMYTLLHYAATRNPALRGGFIHVPYIPEQVDGKPEGTPSMALEEITRALEIAARVVAEEV